MSRPSVRETIAAARARMAKEQTQSKTIRGGAADEREAFMSSGVPGVRRTTPAARRQTDVEVLGHVQKSVKSLIANAKGTGTGNRQQEHKCATQVCHPSVPPFGVTGHPQKNWCSFTHILGCYGYITLDN